MRLGELLIARGLLDDGQLSDALVVAAERGQTLGTVLVDLELVTVQDVLGAVVDQRREALSSGRIGDLLVERGWCTRVQVGKAVARQRATGRLLGEVLVADGVITVDQLMDVLDDQERRGTSAA